ncbi:hypothetical protein ZWY2020_042152 [Hordeum vulgare]|nr:hypothetical protein ZWY2020_042152 [Hordeum vulgare]
MLPLQGAFGMGWGVVPVSSAAVRGRRQPLTRGCSPPILESTSVPEAKVSVRLSPRARRAEGGRPTPPPASCNPVSKIFYMGKQPGNTGPSSASRSANQAVSLREETSGKAQVDVPSLLRVQHLQRLGAWASGEAGVGSIGALLGYRLATNAEAAGIPIGASTFVCQRCESILQPGFNCTIRIKNNKKKAKRRKKSNPGQNSVVYACHFCGDQNLIRGSGKGFVKGLLSSRKPVSVMLKGDNISVPTVTAKNATEHSVTAGSQLEPSRLKTSTLEKDKRVRVRLARAAKLWKIPSLGPCYGLEQGRSQDSHKFPIMGARFCLYYEERLTQIMQSF